MQSTSKQLYSRKKQAKKGRKNIRKQAKATMLKNEYSSNAEMRSYKILYESFLHIYINTTDS